MTHRLHRASKPASDPPAAPEALRRRVLTTVAGKSSANRSRARSIGVAIACVALALGLALAIIVNPSGQRGSARYSSGVASTGAPSVSLRRIGLGGELEISGMPEPPVGEVYEVWLARAGQPPEPTDALFSVTSAGSAAVEIPSELRGLEAVMVTAEPIGGSPSPTSPPVLRVGLAD